jgi:hypothetical protein
VTGEFGGSVRAASSRRAMRPPVWTRRYRAHVSSTVDGGDVRGGGGLLGRVGGGRVRCVGGCSGVLEITTAAAGSRDHGSATSGGVGGGGAASGGVGGGGGVWRGIWRSRRYLLSGRVFLQRTYTSLFRFFFRG